MEFPENLDFAEIAIKDKKDTGMKINSLHLEHYRCFESFDIDFDDSLTVLVGANGAGKTATLDALSVFLRWAGHPVQRGNSCGMPITDVAIGSNAEDIVYRLSAKFSDNADNVFNPLIFIFKKNIHNPRIIKSRAPSAFARIGQLLNKENPVFVGYMAGRFISENDSVLKNGIYTPSEHAAFEKTFERTIDYAATLSWFDSMDADEARAMRDSGQKTEMPELMAVREALLKALLGQYERPRMLGSPSELIIYKKGTETAYKVSQLSDGYRAMLALVMDMARRMAQAHGDVNPQGKPLLHYPAIVLIDEVELHLHPSWQQTVLPTLMDIFPKTQFIVSTHSPQVLTAIPAKHIRILNDGKAYAFTEQTQGAEASRLLKHVFGVDQRPQNLDIVKDLNNYTKLVYDEKWGAAEALELKERLVDHYGDDDPKLMELELHIENSMWEHGL